MTRSTPLLAAFAFLAAGVPAQAQAASLRAEFSAPFERATEVIIDGRQWSCAGNACTSRSDDPRPVVVCRKLARKLGPVTRFTTPSGELDAAGLASCNQDRN